MKKILILKSINNFIKRNEYTVSMNTAFANRFIGHTTDRKGFCTSCERGCTGCRCDYELDFSDRIAGIVSFPAHLPMILDNPHFYLPKKIPDHDILISIAVNEEILISLLKTYPHSKGVIIPIEEPGWISPYAINMITDICKEKRIEIDFPKPFCSFNPNSGILKEFKDYFKIGVPELKINIQDDKITRALVTCSAPCGATYFTAKGLIGKRLDEDLILIIDKLLSSYPCTAGTELDRDFQDSIIHRAVQIQRNVLRSIKHIIPGRIS